MSDERKCYYCGTDSKELRPYGPEGAWLCFDCMTADPAREVEAERQFKEQCAAAGSVVIIGEETGPRPLIRSKQ